MDEHHKHTPGMSERPTKPAQGEAPHKPEKAQKSEDPHESGGSDKAKPQPTPEKS